MNKLLIFIGKDQKFDLDVSIAAISSIDGVRNGKSGKFIGAVFECEYQKYGAHTIVRISPELETITVEGLSDLALEFSIELQRRVPIALRATDMSYGFDVALQEFGSVADLRRAIIV